MKFSAVLSLLPAFAFAGQSFFLDDAETRTAPFFSAYEDSASATGNPEITITVSAADTLAKVLPGHFGNNVNPWLGRALLTDTAYGIQHLKDAGISYLRLPGGNWTNKTLWDGTNHWSLLYDFLDSIKGAPNYTWTLTADEMTALAGQIGAKPQICVNLSLARFIPGPDSVEAAAHYAADWVRHVNGNAATYTRYWEVGNEHYGSWQAGWLVNGDTMDGAYYGRAFCIFADSMKAADPAIKIGAVALDEDNEKTSGGYRGWMRKMLPLIQDKADFLAYHEYFTWKSNINDVTVKEIIAALPLIQKSKDSIDAMVARYTDKAAGDIPLATTEFNVRAGLKDNEAISGIFIAMAISEFIRNGYGLVNLWDIANSYDAENGDQGMLTVDHPTIKDYTPHPSFYTYYLYGKMWGDTQIKTGASAKTSVYSAASRFADGGLSILLVNPTDSVKTVAINFTGYTPDGYAYGYTVRADSATSEKITLNGRTGDIGPLDYAQVPPWRRTAGSAKLLQLPPWSIQFIVFGGNASSGIKVPGTDRHGIQNGQRHYFNLLGRQVK